MRVSSLSIPGPLVLQPAKFEDHRGFLEESFNKARFEEAVGEAVEFVQENHSHSMQGVLRGLHFQRPPRAQAKLVRVVSGEIMDVAVDIRPGSATYGQWIGVLLSAENRKQLWIPAGFAHGFLVTSSSADVVYKLTDYHSPAHEGSILWSDEALSIDWPLTRPPLLSPKDAAAPLLAEAELPR